MSADRYVGAVGVIDRLVVCVCVCVCVSDIYEVILNMDQVTNGLLVHQTHVVYVHGSPPVVPAVNKNGIQLNGLNQYLDAGTQHTHLTQLRLIHSCPRVALTHVLVHIKRLSLFLYV